MRAHKLGGLVSALIVPAAQLDARRDQTVALDQMHELVVFALHVLGEFSVANGQSVKELLERDRGACRASALSLRLDQAFPVVFESECAGGVGVASCDR